MISLYNQGKPALVITDSGSKQLFGLTWLAGHSDHGCETVSWDQTTGSAVSPCTLIITEKGWADHDCETVSKDQMTIGLCHIPQFKHTNEYINGLMRPEFEELFRFREDYEFYFDRFEVLLALEYAHLISSDRTGRFWGPPGRFAWMFQRGENGSPYHQFVSESESQGKSWPVTEAGFFSGSLERFREVASEYAGWIVRLGWH